MLFKNADVFFQGHFQKSDVRVESNLITEVGEALSGDETVDLSGKRILPGLIEVHSHGCMGYDFSTAAPDEIRIMQKHYLKWGITSILATTMTSPFDSYRQAMKNLKEVITTPQSGSRILGINMEGPFLAKEKKGAHDERYLTGIDRELFEELDQLSGNQIKIVCLDPDLNGATEFIADYHQTRAISIAHTSCTYQTAVNAIRSGATQVTHLFNAMNGLQHREPGVVGAVYDSDVRAELICDGIHVHPAVVRLVFGAFPEKMILISDSMCACGLKDGEYELGGQKVFVTGKKATLESGTIAGSVTNVFDCMVNAIQFGVEPEKAILAATLHPAKAVKADDRLGSIEVGKEADLLVTDSEYHLEQVYQSGVKAEF